MVEDSESSYDEVLYSCAKPEPNQKDFYFDWKDPANSNLIPLLPTSCRFKSLARNRFGMHSVEVMTV